MNFYPCHWIRKNGFCSSLSTNISLRHPLTTMLQSRNQFKTNLTLNTSTIPRWRHTSLFWKVIISKQKIIRFFCTLKRKRLWLIDLLFAVWTYTFAWCMKISYNWFSWIKELKLILSWKTTSYGFENKCVYLM